MWLPPRDFVTAQVKGRGSEKYRRGYDNVKSWTSRIDVFKKKFVFIPINQTCVYCAACPPCLHPTPTAHLPSLPGCYRDACVDSLHWSLAIVMNPGNLLVDSSARDATGSSSSRRRSPRHGTPAGQYNRDTTCILFFDSLDVHSQESVCTTIRKCVGAARWVDSVWHSPELCNVCSSSTPRSYLALEAEHGGRAGRAAQQIRVTRTQLPVYSPPVRSQPTTFVVAFSWWFLTAALLQVPKQTNSVDCGVFVIKYIHKFLMDWAFIDNPRPITKTWFKKSTIHQLRKSLQARFRLWCDEKALLASSTPNMQAVNWQRNNYGGAKPSPRVASLDDSLKDASGSGSGSGSGGDCGSDSDGGRRHRHRRRGRHRRKSRGRGHDGEGARPVSVRVDMHGATPAGSHAAAASGDDVDGVHAHTPPLPDDDQHPSQARAPSPPAVSASGGSAPVSQASMMALPSAASAVRGR